MGYGMTFWTENWIYRSTSSLNFSQQENQMTVKPSSLVDEFNQISS